MAGGEQVTNARPAAPLAIDQRGGRKDLPGVRFLEKRMRTIDPQLPLKLTMIE
jgi:hypothetical protein